MKKLEIKSVVCIALIAIVSIFFSPLYAQDDRATFGLKGNVTKVSPDHGNQSVYPIGENKWVTYDLVFSSTGKLEEVKGMHVTSESFAYEHEIQRDSKNRISQLSSVAGEGVQWVVFHYDTKGRVSSEDYIYENLDTGEKENVGNVVYYYDDNDNMVKAVVYDKYEAKANTMKYTYKKTDESGNWTERVVNCPDLGLNNQQETRTLSYTKEVGAVSEDDSAIEPSQTGTDGVSVPNQSKKRSFWDILFGILLVAALIFMIVYMGYILVFRDRNLIPKTVEGFKKQRLDAGLPEESSDSENEEVMQLFREAGQNLTRYKDAQGDIAETFTTKEQIEKLRSALVRCQEIAPTTMELLEIYNESLEEYKFYTKRFFMGSKTYLIVGGIITVLMTFGAGFVALPFMLLNICGYYFASKETQFMINAKELKGTSSRGRSKVMTAITAAAFGVLFSGQTYKTVTTWSDGTTTTDYDNDEHIVALIFGLIILAFLAFFMFVVAMVNFIRNYLIYK